MRSNLRFYGLVAVALALVIGAIAGWRRWFDAYGGADDLDAALVYPAGGGAQLVILDRVSHQNRFDTDYTPRLSLWVPGEDAPRIRKRVPGARMLAAGAQLLWLYSHEHGVHARDPATLEVRVDEEELRRRNPALAVGLMPPDSFELFKLNSGRDEATGGLVVTTKDAQRFLIDLESFAAKPFAGERMQEFLTFSGLCVATGKAPEQPRVELRGNGPRQEVQLVGRSAGEFVTPQRLDVCLAEASPASDVAFITHRGSLEETTPSRLTALSAKDGVLWTAELTKDTGWRWVQILFASVSTGDVILVVKGERGTFAGLGYGLMTLDRADGRIKSSTDI